MSEGLLHELEFEPIAIGRYVLHRQIARGGMATIHIARLMGDEGFNRIVAAKRLNPEFCEDSEFVAMFLDEARVASKVQHRNVVPVLDVVTAGEEVILVQEYVHGVPLQWLSRTLREGRFQLPLGIAVSIACQLLSGLHATHETTDELGTPLHIVHRDVSPQNVMLAVDGSARLLDFGVAKAAMAAHVTREGTYKGKLAYSAPEQLCGTATRQSDIYSLSVLLWELVVGQRMHGAARTGAELITTVLNGELPGIREALRAGRSWDTIAPADRQSLERLDPIVRKGLAVDVAERWSTAAEMEAALAAALPPAPLAVVAAWLKRVGKPFLEQRQRMIAEEEASWRHVHAASPARGSGPPGHDSFVNLRAFGRGKKGLPADLIVRDSERGDALLHARLLAPACVVLAALALALAIIVWRRGAQEPAALAPAAQQAEPAAARALPAGSALPVAAAPRGREGASAPLPGASGPDPSEGAAEPSAGEGPPEPAPSARAAESAPEHGTEPAPSATAGPIAPAPAPRAPQDAEQLVRLAPRAPRRARPPEPRREPEADPAKPAPAKAPADCAIPYYFEGSKKLFKPACL